MPGPWQEGVPPCPTCGKALTLLGSIDLLGIFRCPDCKVRVFVEEQQTVEPRRAVHRPPGVWSGARES